MLISVIVSVKKDLELVGTAKKIILKLGQMDYPAGQFEIIFSVPENSRSEIKSFQGLPLVRIIYGKENEALTLNYSISRAHGDVILITGIKSVFEKGDLKELSNLYGVKTKVNDRLILKSGFFAFPSFSPPAFPGDCYCFRTTAFMQFLLKGYPIIGRLGKANKKEIVRYAYLFDKLKLNKKILTIIKMLAP